MILLTVKWTYIMQACALILIIMALAAIVANAMWGTWLGILGGIIAGVCGTHVFMNQFGMRKILRSHDR